MPILFTFDLETENYESNKRRAAPFDKRNYIVQIGYSVNGGKATEEYYTSYHREPVMPIDIMNKMGKGDMFIGFNIKFDMLWVWSEPAVQAALKRGATVYCGQYAEYLLGGMQQEVQMISMNETAEQYGGGQKIDAVKEMWESGMLTSQIPRGILTDYLVGDGKEIVGDVMNTWLIFAGQVARMKECHPAEFREGFKLRMDGYLATMEMEYNGVHCDLAIGEANRKDLVKDLDAATKKLEEFIPEMPSSINWGDTEPTPDMVFSWSSPIHKSCLIFGGVAKYQKWVQHADANGNGEFAQMTVKWPQFQMIEDEELITKAIDPLECIKAGPLYVLPVPIGTDLSFEHKGKAYIKQLVFKGGKNKGVGKTKNIQVPDLSKPKGCQQDFFFKFEGYTKPHHTWKGAKTDAYDQPLYSTNAKVVETLAKRGIPFTDALTTRTALDKDLGTYYYKEDKNGKRKGMLTLVGDDGIIHHKLNHVNTVTSRLSASDPNMQNIPRKDKSVVKKMFTSRFAGGKMSEIDYSQLEVVVQGVLTRDPQLMRDLNDKVDFHLKRLSVKLNRAYDELWDLHHKQEDPVIGEQRTGAKVFSFQRAYGAGVATIVDDTGMSKSDVEALVAAEEQLYPGISAFDRKLERAIETNRVPTEFKLFLDGVVFARGEAHWDSPTGTRYMWREDITPVFLHKHGKYTGFSPTERKNYPVQGTGGEIVQAMLGKVFRYFIENDRFGGKLLLVNTVHDCIWLDGEADLVAKHAPIIQGILESVPEVFNKAFPKLNVEVPFPCETEVGDDMFKMTVLH